MSNGNVQRSCLYVEIDGEIYIVALSQQRMKMLIQLAAGLSDSGQLVVKKAPEGTKFEEIV